MSVTILNGDCREMLRTLDDESANCVVTSPPYWGLRDYGQDAQIGQEDTPEAFVEELASVFLEVRRVLRRDGTLWLNLGDSYASGGHGGGGRFMKMRGGEDAAGAWSHRSEKKGWRSPPPGLKDKDLVGIPWRVAFALQADGWYLRQDIVWAKPNPMPESVQDRCTKSHEYLFLLTRNNDYAIDMRAIREPCVRPDEGKRKTPAVFGGRNKFTEAKKQSRLHSGNEYIGTSDGMRNRRSVWNVASQSFKGAHFATFPPKLIEPCILAGCPEGGTVLDPFFGAGTTGLVCQQLNRNCIGIELNPEYVDIAQRRLGLPQPEYAW